MNRIALLMLPLLINWGCKPNSSPTENNETMTTKDVHSYSNPEHVVIRHLSLDLQPDFTKKVISGDVKLEVENLSGAKEIELDTKDLNIQSVLVDNGPSTFTLGKPDPLLGSRLTIPVKPETKNITITYSTSPSAAALQWLEPSQTAGGKHPFLFTQSQAILARTWIPLQDSPGVKFTYDAKVTVPPGLMAVMSAGNDTTVHADGVYYFKMPQPIPSYLMALAVGNLAFHSYDERSGVFAEPELIKKAAWEFEDLPEMITSAEALYGTYAWGRYDILVLPPSFPFGGMENPRITFATPTIIAGDRSLVALIAHELAHSWSGNLVTNATWNDFWLNEGFTVYFETRIMEKIYGKEYADMLTLLSLGELKETIHQMGENSRETWLYGNYNGRDPDEGVNDIAYEKGRFFLATIEQAVGREKWDAFLNQYFNAYAFKTMDTKGFLDYLDRELIEGNENLRKQINVNAWVYGPGLPDNCPVVTSDELKKAEDAATAFKNGAPAKNIVTTNWTTHHWLHFLRSLDDSLDVKKMTELDQTFGFTNSGNSEIQCEWYQHAIASRYEKAYPAMEKFLLTVGRRKFLKPLYGAMAKDVTMKKMALEIYKKARPGYHAVSTQTIDSMLGV